MHYNYRLYLSGDIQSFSSEKIAEDILNKTSKWGITRVAINLTGENKSISLLSKSEDAKSIQAEVTQLLSAEQITVTGYMEQEILAYEEDIAYADYEYIPDPKIESSPGKKRKKKSAHNHDQCHNHSHEHNHSHDHTPGSSHDHVPDQPHAHNAEHSHTHTADHPHDHTSSHPHAPGHPHTHTSTHPDAHASAHPDAHASAHPHGHASAHPHGHASAHPHGHASAHPHGHAHDDDHGHCHGHHHENHWIKAAIGLIWGIGLIVLSVASFNIPMIAYYIMTGLTSLVTLYLGYTAYKASWDALWKKKWDTATLYTISTLTIVIVSIASLFIPGLPMMFEAAPLILGFWHLAEGIEHTLVNEINRKLDVRDCIQPQILLKSHPENKKVFVKTLIPNDIILLNDEDVIPVDGVLTENAQLYTTQINGSAKLKKFKAGDPVKAGMRLSGKPLTMRVTKTYQSSYLSLVAQNISQANAEKAPVELFVNRILKYFIPGLLCIALISGIIIGLCFTPALALQCVISVLVSACPCALSLVTPLAVKIGIKKAFEHGIRIDNGKTLQAAAEIDTIVFDLNGTLTQGKIVVDAVHIDDESFLNHIALLESHSDHPVAHIIVSHFNQNLAPTEPLLSIKNIDKSHHAGIKGEINDEIFMIGNKEMLATNQIQITAPYNHPEKGSIYIVRGKKVIGQISLTDPLRDDAIDTVKYLTEKMNKKVHICTGSDQESAQKYALLLGIPTDHICANAVGVTTSPDERSKENYIQELKSQGRKVAMVGDAANDVTAITRAHVGIAVVSKIGDIITQKSAGIVLQQGYLFPIVTAFDVAQKTKSNIYRNLFISLAYNLAITLVASGLFVALGFALNPIIGVALVILESIIVLLNLYHFKQQEIVSTVSNLKNSAPNLEHPEPQVSSALSSLNDLRPSKTNLAAKELDIQLFDINHPFTLLKKTNSTSCSANEELNDLTKLTEKKSEADVNTNLFFTTFKEMKKMPDTWDCNPPSPSNNKLIHKMKQ